MTASFDDLADKVARTWDQETREVFAAASAYFAAQTQAQLNLGEQVAALRKERQLTQAELASASGIPQPEISRIEKGVGNPTRDTLLRLAHALGSQLVFLPEIDRGRKAAST